LKPQFEAGRARIGKGGIVRDPEVHRAVLRETRDGLATHGLVVIDVAASPLRGADGNTEFLFHARLARSGASPATFVDDAKLDAVVAWAAASPSAASAGSPA
ncbi:MAG: SAM-dependent methyltransferase, partial [Acidimicrobiia bacterium]